MRRARICYFDDDYGRKYAVVDVRGSRGNQYKIFKGPHGIRKTTRLDKLVEVVAYLHDHGSISQYEKNTLLLLITKERCKRKQN